MRAKLIFVLTLALLNPAAQLSSQQPVTGSPAIDVDFRTDIQPILAANCVSCHRGSRLAAGELWLDTQDGLLRGGSSGKAIVPGDAEQSLLVKRIADTGNKVMPPTGDALSSEQIALIKAWINQGAKVPEPVDFATDVQPILTASCYECHSGSQPKAQLRLDVKSLALKGGLSGPVIVPGNSKESRLIHRVRGDGGERQMPLEKTPLEPEKIGILARWIDEGPNWPEALSGETNAAIGKHWAYVKPVRPTPPKVTDGPWVRNPIDNFILAHLEKEGLRPSAEVPRETLIRRVSLDLLGLPPSPREVDEFVHDTRPDAYERLIDRLLASPQYGERWATPWLDLARYGDSEGGQTDGDGRRDNAWPYRDWVINAFNKNMPFDQFAIEQVAGDMLPNATTDQKVATGFLRATPSLMDEEDVLERASAVGTVFLGATIGCATCHNHKYDPYTQKQFYQMAAFFTNTATAGRNAGTLELPSPDQKVQLDKLSAEQKRWQDQLNDSSPEYQQFQEKWERELVAAEANWQPLHPTRLTSTDGTTLTTDQDGFVLASGINPEKETYILEAKAPLAGQITGIRIEAVPDPSLPRQGPGRDYYGNFMVHEVNIEAGSSVQQLAKVSFKELAYDEVLQGLGAGNINTKIPQVWRADPARDVVRARRQMLMVPEKPLQLNANDVFRISLVHLSEFSGVNLGRFRVSVTTSENPKQVVDIPVHLRPLLTVEKEKRGMQKLYSFSLGGAPQSKDDPVAGHWRTTAVELASIREKIAEVESQIQALGIPTTLVMTEKPGFNRPSTFVRIRGALLNKGEEAFADVPPFLGSLPQNAPANRLGLAMWLVNKDNPLTARVRVNQIWQAYFGRGIVETSEDFGTQGTRPSHPELLDWLATEFMAKGWDQKAMHRLILTSNTYRQSSNLTPEMLERDPENILLSRGPRFRVEAEMVRDIALAASGLLSSKIGGPPVMPPQPDGLWLFPGGGDDNIWTVSEGEDRYRRGIYTFIRRSVRYPSLTVFDAPNREFCTARRPRTTTPLQALTTLNDPVFVEFAQAMAQRIVKEGGADTISRITYGFRLVTSRKPDALETKMLLTAFDKQRQEFERDRAEAEAWAGKPDPELAAWTVISNSLLNFDETLTKE